MMTFEEITVDERIKILEHRIDQLEEFLTDVASDMIDRLHVSRSAATVLHTSSTLSELDEA